MTQRSTLALLGVVLALAAYVFFFERDTTSSSELEERKARFVTSFVRDRLSGIVIERGGEVIELTRTQSDAGIESFALARPIRSSSVDDDAVDTLVSGLEWAEPVREAGGTSAAELRRFGLARPRVRVTLVLGSRRVHVAFGSADPTGQGVYATSSDQGGKVFVVGKDVFEAVDHDSSAYRVRRLAPLDLPDAKHVAVTTPAYFSSAALEQGVWWTQGSGRSHAARDHIETLVAAFRDLEAVRFERPTARLEQAGIPTTQSSPASFATVRVTFADVELALTVGNVCGEGRYARMTRVCNHDQITAHAAGCEGADSAGSVHGPLACIANESVALLVPGESALVERRVVSAGNDTVKGLKLTDGVRTLEITEQNGAFRYVLRGVTPEQAGSVEADALAEMLDGLRGAGAVNVLEPAAAAGRTFGARIETTLREGPSDVVELSMDADPILARRVGDAKVLELPASARALLEPSVLSIMRRALLEEIPESLSEITLVRGTTRETVKREASGMFVVTAPVAAPANLSAAAALWTRLSALEAVRFVAPAPLPEHQLTGRGARSISMRFSGDDGHGHGGAPSEHTLTIGAATDAGAFARLDGGAVFVIARATLELIDAPLVARDLLLTEALLIDAIDVENGVTMRREGNAFVSDAGVVSPAQQRALVDAVSELDATPTAYGIPASSGFSRPRARITVSRGTEAPAPARYVIIVGAADGEHTHVRREDLAIDFLVPSSAVSAFLATAP